MSEHRWYAVQVTAGHENKVRSLIARRIQEDTRPDADSVLAAGRADLCLIRPSRVPSLASAMQRPLWA